MKRETGADAFELFCLYYLGLTPEGEYQFCNANKIAARLNWSVAELFQTLRGHDLHPDTVLNTDFPLARYQADVQIAAAEQNPELLLDFAREIYALFRGSAGKRRDWLAEIEREKKEGNPP